MHTLIFIGVLLRHAPCTTTHAICFCLSSSWVPWAPAAKVAFVEQLLAAKAASGKSFDAIAAECGWTNAYTAQLFFNQVGGGW